MIDVYVYSNFDLNIYYLLILFLYYFAIIFRINALIYYSSHYQLSLSFLTHKNFIKNFLKQLRNVYKTEIPVHKLRTNEELKLYLCMILITLNM
jgi:hypothetical protein